MHPVCMRLDHVDPDPSLPGADLVQAGLADLGAGRRTEAALLVGGAAHRLRALGYDVSDAPVDNGELYELVRRRVGDARAHSTYNALRRRLVSFLNSARG
jgi:hypothetical protein